MTRLAQGLFAALVLATFAAFFVAQRLKSSPPRIEVRGIDPLLSPNRDGRKDAGGSRSCSSARDSVDVAIVESDGDLVRELVSGRAVARRASSCGPSGTAATRPAAARPTATYRVRINLRRQGQTVVAPRRIVLDTTPPKPRVLSIGPETGKRPRAGDPADAPRRARRHPLLRARHAAVGRDLAHRPAAPAAGREPGIDTELRDGQLPNGVGRTTWDGTRDGRRVVARHVRRGRPLARRGGQHRPLGPRAHAARPAPPRRRSCPAAAASRSATSACSRR